MKESILKYQVALFGSFDDISPTTETVRYLIDEFAFLDLVPSVHEEIELQPGTTRIMFGGGQKRITLTATDGSWSVDIGLKRIDIQNQVEKIDAKLSSVEDFVSNAKDIVNKIDAKFPRKYHRLSFITRRFFSEIGDDENAQIVSKIFNTIPIYKENVPVEWQSRFVTRITSEFNGEILNVISTLNKGTINFQSSGEIEPVDGIDMTFDLNTFQENTEYRFDAKGVHGFLDMVSKLEGSISTDYAKLIS